jgi:DNA-binding NtrC family response regulator
MSLSSANPNSELSNDLGVTSAGEKHILLVDGDDAFGEVLQQVLGEGYRFRRAANIESALGQLDLDDIETILVNTDSSNEKLLSEQSRALLRAVSERYPALPIIAYGLDCRRQKAVEAIREGAFDFMPQPLDIKELKFALDQACRRAALTRELADVRRLLFPPHVEGLLGNSKAMVQVNEVIRKVSDVFTTILLTGESGTGKGVVAQAIHRMSPRAAKPFVAFSVCAFPDSMIEEELFGHEKGAFTGATQSRRGRFEEANGGTIFLDEIGDLGLPLQAKLLRVLQERTIERLGSNVSRPVDARVICATSRDLGKMVQEGTFREDLYFRISVVKIHMPPLRERTQDIPLLAEYFLRTFAKSHNKKARSFSPAFLSALASYRWPGNVRELQNVIERSVVLANGNEQLGVRDLPEELREFTISEDVQTGSFHEAVRTFKRELVRSALRAHSGNKLKAARELGISRCYLHRLLNTFKVNGYPTADESLDWTLEAESEAEAQESNLESKAV